MKRNLFAGGTRSRGLSVNVFTESELDDIHPNVGMGVGGVPMSPYPPADAVSRVSRALVDILKVDGL